MAKRKQVIWSELADIQFNKALIYCQKNENFSFSERLIIAVDETINIVLSNNEIGKPIPKSDFRSTQIKRLKLNRRFLLIF
jgi:hypothetical protein